MNDTLARLADYRRTWNLIHRWKCPAGITLALIEWPQDLRIDVVLSAQGMDETLENVVFDDAEEANCILDYAARTVTARVVAAYDAHEVAGKGTLLFDLAMDRAGRRFEEGIESAMCRGKGGDE